MVKKVLYPGSFDPWHVGHQFVWKSACELVGEENVWIGLATDVKKFKPSEQFPSSISKCEFLKWALVPLKAQTIVVKNTSVETCREIEASFMVRGLRPSYDLPQEAALDFWNKKLSRGNIKTMFFMTPDNINHLSSTAIREMGFS
jgi:pantetheine-phosphate adenylyltransferase